MDDTTQRVIGLLLSGPLYLALDRWFFPRVDILLRRGPE